MPYQDHEIFKLNMRIKKLEAQVKTIYETLGIELHEDETEGASPEVMELVRQGRKIQAIKQFRTETGVGLKDAKDFIDSLFK